MLDGRMFLGGVSGCAVIAALYRPGAAPQRSFEIQKTEAEQRRVRTPAQFDILRRNVFVYETVRLVWTPKVLED